MEVIIIKKVLELLVVLLLTLGIQSVCLASSNNSDGRWVIENTADYGRLTIQRLGPIAYAKLETAEQRTININGAAYLDSNGQDYTLYYDNDGFGNVGYFHVAFYDNGYMADLTSFVTRQNSGRSFPSGNYQLKATR